MVRSKQEQLLLPNGVTNMSNRKQDFITEVRNANRKIWDGINDLVALQREWTALDYGTTLPLGEGDNDGITNAQVSDVLFTSTNALVATLNSGHSTNMAKLL